MSVKILYPSLASLLINARKRAGLATQGDLAKLLGSSQQSVSRWEAGTSRPSAKQLPKIAAVLGVDTDELAQAAGYFAPSQTVTFDRPFPFENLSPESFERFTSDLVQALFPGAEIHRAGGQGHTQDGIDIAAKFADGRRFTFQCKQVAEFGPKKVTQAIAADKSQADRKFLVLSRVASPDARAVIDKKPGWTLWDRDDLSRKIRELSIEDQRRLVRIYFSGQYEALLGIPASGPWETKEEFFAPFATEDKLFTHAWSLVGRQQLVSDIGQALASPEVGVILLAGAGGIGKTRVLKALLEQFSAAQSACKVRIASPTEEITKGALEELGTADLLLVVDDAHDRDDLQTLFAYAASKESRTKLLLAARPYGIDHICAQASNYSFVEGPQFRRFNIPSLSIADAEHLAGQVLERLGASKDTAKQIAEFTYDCTLATVIGARVVAEEKIHPLLIHGEERFRQALLGRFEDVVAGHLAGRESEDHVRKVLGFLALLQPISIDDKRLLCALDDVEKVGVEETQRILKLLIDAGVLFKRGARHRLSPDVLGDYLIEKHFEGVSGQSNGLAERYFDAVPDTYLENILLNMGRIDWRRTGQTSDSRLLDGIWKKLKPTQQYSDAHLKAVEAVAYYQPVRALDFVEKLIREGRFTDQLSGIAKYAGYSRDHFPRALECLWEIGRRDERSLGQHPSHAIRVLKEMAEPSPGKPYWVVRGVVDFFIGVAQRADAWSDHYTAFDILEGALQTEGFTSRFQKHQWTMSPYFVDPANVADVRSKIVELLIESLADVNSRKAIGSARCLGETLRGPIGILGASAGPDLHKKWDREFAQTLSKIRDVLDQRPVSPAVQAELGRTIAYREAHGGAAVKKAAKAVRATLSSDLDTRIERLLTDGYGHEDMRLDGLDDHDKRWQGFIQQTVSDITTLHTNADRLLDMLEARVVQAEMNGQSTTPEVLMGILIEQADGFAVAVIEAVVANRIKKLSRFLGHALSKIFRGDPAAGRSYMDAFLQSGRRDLKIGVGLAYDARQYADEWLQPGDVANIELLLVDDDEAVLLTVMRAVRLLSEWNQDLALTLLRRANIPTARVADEFALAFEFGRHLSLSKLTHRDVADFLGKIKSIPELDGYWLEKFLADISEVYPRELARFFMQRVEKAATTPDYHFRPCNYGPWLHQPLRFRKAADGLQVMREVAAWMRQNIGQRNLFNYHAANLFQAMFAPFDNEIVSFLSDWLKAATEEDMLTIATIIGEADRDFVMRHASFMVALMDQAHQFGPKMLRTVGGELFSSAINGIKSGTSGQPFPEDIALKENAEAVLSGLSRFSPAFELYDGLRQHAEAQIARAREDAEEDE